MLIAVTVLQAMCALYFLFDVSEEFAAFGAAWMHALPEFIVVSTLLLGTALGIYELRGLLRRNRDLNEGMRVASGAFLDVMEESFARWGLTASERDVALLSIKGLSIAEIAALRETRTGTVKAQSAAVYRKAGVTGRAQLISHFVEDLMAGVVLEPASGRPAGASALPGAGEAGSRA